MLAAARWEARTRPGPCPAGLGGTPDEEREALEASIRATDQQVEAEPLAPNQRRGHVSWLDRVKHLLNR